MYSWEEIKALGFFLGAAMLGRMLFYRSLMLEGSFKQRVKVRILRWLWELPVILAIALTAFEIVTYFELRHTSGVIIAVVMGFMGLETLKVWIDDYMETRFLGKNPGRRASDEDSTSE